MFDYWQKQTQKPLFPDMLWSRPENKKLLPKVAIVGGSEQGFALSAAIYQSANESGCSQLKLVLPDSLQPTLPANLDFIFTKSTKTGSHSKDLYDQLRALQTTVDVIVISEDVGQGSEATQSIHKILAEDSCDLIFVGKAALVNDTYFDELIKRQTTITLVMELPQLQKVASRLPTVVTFKLGDGLVDIARGLHELSTNCGNLVFVIPTEKQVIIAENGTVYSTANTSTTIEQLSGKIVSFYNNEPAKNYITSLYE